MDLKKFFPFSTKAVDTNSLIISIILYVIAPSIAGVVVSWLSWIPIVGWLISIAASLFGLYCLIGLILAILYYCKVIKD